LTKNEEKKTSDEGRQGECTAPESALVDSKDNSKQRDTLKGCSSASTPSVKQMKNRGLTVKRWRSLRIGSTTT